MNRPDVGSLAECWPCWQVFRFAGHAMVHNDHPIAATGSSRSRAGAMVALRFEREPERIKRKAISHAHWA